MRGLRQRFLVDQQALNFGRLYAPSSSGARARRYCPQQVGECTRMTHLGAFRAPLSAESKTAARGCATLLSCFLHFPLHYPYTAYGLLEANGHATVRQLVFIFIPGLSPTCRALVGSPSVSQDCPSTQRSVSGAAPCLSPNPALRSCLLGPYSPQVDERCFTYCSQSISGRIHGSDPWCRTICLRRVFSHEVSRILSHHRTQTITDAPGRKQPLVETKEEVQTQPLNHPLPPEGQRYNGWLAMLLHGGFGLSADGDDLQRGHPDDPDSPLVPGPTHSQSDIKYWQEGWYLWWSSSRWAAQEKLDLMRRDLEGQTEWQKLKDRRNDEWARGLPPFEEAQGDGQAHGDLHPFEDLGNLPPFPDVS